MSILHRMLEEEEVNSYWESLLGEEMLAAVLREPEYEKFLEQELQPDQEELQEFLQSLSEGEVEKEREEWVFYPFYKCVCCYVQRKLERVFLTKHPISVKKDVSCSLARQYVKKMQEIPLRCLLQEMEELRQEEKLLGQNEKQEYEFFLQEYLNKKAYLTELAEKYPVMMALIFKKTNAYASSMEEMLHFLEQEKEQIENRICQGKKIRYIQSIQTGLSDEHTLGKTVTRIVFDNECVVYYKTRSLKPEVQYQNLYHWICRKCGLKCYDRGILDCETHGWEGEAATAVCQEIQEVERYYERIGIHLCLCYLFGVSDIHFENIIPHGEYPVLIDMEVFPGYRENAAGQKKDVRELIRDSVLSTGILPGQSWGNASVNVSAMGSRKKQKSPFKVPVIKEKNTSHMHVAYEYAEVNSMACIPKCKECEVEPETFISAVKKGFDEAYECMYVQKERLIEEVSAVSSWKSRFVMRHTQQYRMYQITAAFPEFMTDAQARRLILLRMEKGLRSKEQFRKKLLLYEAEAVMQETIPVYYVNGTDLQMGNGICIPGYFKETPQEQVIARLQRMGAKDKYRQQKWIALSLSVMEAQNAKTSGEGNNILLTAHQIAAQIQTDAEQEEGSAQWLILKYGSQRSWQFGSMGWYLYDGMAGIAVFLMAYGHVYGMEKYQNLRENVIAQMFQYTEEEVRNGKKTEPLHTGIMNGESSIVYTYLVLYRMSGEERFLEYAKKHAQIVAEYLEEDRQCDILEGNAGAVIAMVHLYQITKEAMHLEIAQQAAEILINQIVPMEKGIGWCIPGQEQPLAGMAHGNSGIMMAFARLWQITGNPTYCEIVEQAREYEDSLYNQAMGNWQDMRSTGKEHGRDVTAWCHGAAGILIAAANIDDILGIDFAADWHLQCAKEKICKTEQKQYCLCHGKMGNAAALRYGNEKISDIVLHSVSKEGNRFQREEISDYEIYQMGFMTGLSGIGYELLKREDSELPELLALEL